MFEQIRPSRPGDGEGMARVWLSAGAYYADLDPAHFRVPSAEGLAESFEADIEAKTADADSLRLVAERDSVVTGWLAAAESWGGDRGASIVQLTTYAKGPVAVPFYERHVGYERRSILFQKPLT
jgi:hypothetical protein